MRRATLGSNPAPSSARSGAIRPQTSAVATSMRAVIECIRRPYVADTRGSNRRMGDGAPSGRCDAGRRVRGLPALHVIDVVMLPGMEVPAEVAQPGAHDLPQPAR